MAVIKNSSCKANACCNLPDLHFETGLFRGCFMVLEAATRSGEVNQLLGRTETLAGGSARTVFAPPFAFNLEAERPWLSSKSYSRRGVVEIPYKHRARSNRGF